jgi:hypothetical protein
MDLTAMQAQTTKEERAGINVTFLIPKQSHKTTF